MWGAAYGGNIMSEIPSKIREMMTEIDELKENFKRIKGNSGQLNSRSERKEKK